jgi:hypothetical protein
MWQLSHCILATNSMLYHRHIRTDKSCPMCKAAEEDYFHRFFACSINSQALATLANLHPNIRFINKQDIFDLNFKGHAAVILVTEYMYSCWSERNTVVFGRGRHTPRSLDRLFVKRLRLRIKADYTRLNKQVFEKIWCKEISVCRMENDLLVFNV